MRLILALVLCWLSPCLALAQTATVGETPDWVEIVEIPVPSPEVERQLRAAARGGIFQHLYDTQVAWVGEERQRYVRIVQEVTDRAGLEPAATLQFGFDPERDSVVLTHLDIVRDGERIDLAGEVAWETFRREERLDVGILDGILTAVIIVPGLQTGDVVDYGVLYRTMPYFPGDQRGSSAWLELTQPAILVRHVLNWPKDWTLYTSDVPERVSHRSEERGETVRHVWERSEFLPPREETDTPVEDLPYAYVDYSDTSSWQGVVDALAPYYSEDYPLAPAWAAEVDRISAASTDPRERTRLALRAIQDEVRYVSLSIGIGGILARTPETVAASGFGDCKDKSLLLVTMLKAMGIDGVVALTDLDEGYMLGRQLPRLTAFDHMIVRVRIDGETYWLDPTMTHQGGRLDENVGPDVGFALPLDPAAPARMEKVERTEAMLWTSNVTEYFSFQSTQTALTVKTFMRGAAAETWRYRLATEGRAALEDDLMAYYRSYYPGLEIQAPLVARDDRERNVFTLEESYRLPAAGEMETGLLGDFPFGSEDYAEGARLASRDDRQTPYLLGRGRRNTHTVLIWKAPVDFTPPDNVHLSNEVFDYDFTALAQPGGIMSMRWYFAMEGRTASADQMRAIRSGLREVHEGSRYWYNLEPGPAD